MEHHKTWLWKKKSSSSSSSDIVPSSKELEQQQQEIQILRNEKAELENELITLHDKLSCALSERNEKEQDAKNKANTAREASAGWEKATTEIVSLRQELDLALQQKLVADERISQLDAALKECMQQLRFVRDEQEKRIHDVVTKATKEFEKSKMLFDEKLAETTKRLSKLSDENTCLSKALLAKEKSNQDLSVQNSKLEADLTSLVGRLESSEKDNTSLKYEVRVLEKEVEIWNEEREFNRRSADALHKQHLDSAKKIAKLELECQRLRLLVRKRLPGPAALAKMKDEVEILGRRRPMNSSPNRSLTSAFESSLDTSTDFLTEQLCSLAEENKNLKEALDKKINELQFSRTMYANAALKLSEIDSQLEESPKGMSISDIGIDNNAESRASALISKLENLKSGNPRESPSSDFVRVSDISLMDDFVEMEKLAIVSEKNPSIHSDESVAFSVSGPSESGNSSDGKGVEIVPLPEVKKFETLITNDERLPSDLSKSLCKIIELIEGISLPSADYVNSGKLPDNDENSLNYKSSETYVVRVFQWKTSELGPVSQQVTQTCYDLINGKADVNRFAEEISSALEWIMNHCFSLQDVSSMKEAIKKQLHWDEARTESETENEQLKRNLLNLEAKKKDLEESLQSAVDKCEHLSNQLEDSETSIERLLKEVETSKESKGVVEDQDKSKIEDVETPLSLALAELNEASHKISTMKVELEDKSNSYEELEAKCLDLQLQLESLTNRETSSELKQEEKPLKSSMELIDSFITTELISEFIYSLTWQDLEISAASEKLAECQETILNLGKQLKALASSRDAPLFDKVNSIPTTTMDATIAITPGWPMNKLTHQGSSLLDRMIAEDDAKSKGDESPNAKNGDNGTKRSGKDVAVNSLAIVPRKKARNVSLWRKLLLRKRKSFSSKTTLPFAP
ncbi:hypothetical protein ACFE04_022671 [Oxalis oulophora]